jgi:hypothetical protein
MEQAISSLEETITLYLKHAFVKNGSIILRHDVRGEFAGFSISSDECCDPTTAVCPYCEGTNNVHSLKNTGIAVPAKDNETGVTHEFEINGFRCTTCFNFWVMLISNKGRSISLGLKPAQVN